MPVPSVTSLLRQGFRYFYGETHFADFSGGWNIRDAQGQLAANESPDLYNVTLDERGGISKRLGYVKYNGSAFGASLVNNAFYWPSGQNLITQAGATLYKDTNTTAFNTFSTAARVGFADFTGKLYIIHPIDGLFSYDGATVTAVAAGPKGSTLCAWQNKLWAAGLDETVYFSKAGDATHWYQNDTTSTGSHTLPVATVNCVDTTGFTPTGSINFGGQTVAYTGVTATTFTGCSGGAGTFGAGTLIFQGTQNFNKLREKDTEPIVCLTGASGIDISGRPGLLAFKRRSTYRIFDSATAQYQTLDPAIGAASAISVVNGFQRTVALGESGIYWTDGVGPMRPASDKIQTLFDPTQIAFDQLDLFCGGVKGDRMYFSLARAGQTANNLELEHHPVQGWIVASSAAASCYATYGKNNQILYAGSPTVVGQVYKRLTGGTDGGAAITSRYQGRWAEPTGGHQIRVSRARVVGRGSFTLDVFTDYQLAPSASLTVSLSSSQAIYDNAAAIYDQAGVLYGPLKYQSFQDFPQLGVMRAISLRFSETSSTSTVGLQILGVGAAPEAGAFGSYGVSLSYVPLGIG